MNALSTQTKWIIYAGLNLAFCTALIIGKTAGGGGDLTQLPYVVLLFAICTSPLPFVGRLNGAVAMLGVAMTVYFVEFGALDAMSMLRPPPVKAMPALEDEGIGRTDVVLWLGALMQILGFLVGARLTGSRRPIDAPKDWPRQLLLPAGILLWVAAALATLYHDFVVQPANTAAAIKKGLESLGVWRASGLMLIENYAGPLGIMIVAYWWAVWESAETAWSRTITCRRRLPRIFPLPTEYAPISSSSAACACPT